jgi:retron-type reverse transcriptase
MSAPAERSGKGQGEALPVPCSDEAPLGIPTVTDRLIQQVLLQVLQPLLDPTFSQHS